MEKMFKLIALNRVPEGCSGTVEHFHTDSDYARCSIEGSKAHQRSIFDYFKGGQSLKGYSALVRYEKITELGLPIDGVILKIIPPTE
jgi:hypothetical protein